MTAQEFQDVLVKGLCPFCKEKLQFYDGLLGYEAMRCYCCKFEVDEAGFRFMEESLASQGNGSNEDEGADTMVMV